MPEGELTMIEDSRAQISCTNAHGQQHLRSNLLSHPDTSDQVDKASSILIGGSSEDRSTKIDNMPGFAVGCSQRFRVTRGQYTRRPTSICHAATDSTGTYLAILTAHDLQIWSGSHNQLLLGWIKVHLRHEVGVGDGVYVKPGVVWNRNSEELCVLGLDGVLSFFCITPGDRALIAGIEPSEWVDMHPGGHSPVIDPPDVVHIELLRRLVLQGQGATCISAGAWARHILIGKDREAAILHVSWAGELEHEYKLTHLPDMETELSKQSAAKEHALILLQLAYSDVCHLAGAVLTDGTALVTNLPSSSYTVKTLPSPSTSRSEALAFSPADAVLAVGYEDGSVAIYRIVASYDYMSSPLPSTRRGRAPSYSVTTSKSRSASLDKANSADSEYGEGEGDAEGQVDAALGHTLGISEALAKLDWSAGPLYPSGESESIFLILCRRLSLASLGFETRHIGAVHNMEFSPDGGSLAAAHSRSSLNVWDTSQWCRPMTTFPRVPTTPEGPAAAAIPCLVWVDKGYRLLAAHNEVTDGVAYASLVRYEMLKWARHAALADTSLCLQGLSTVAFLEPRSWNPRMLSWTHLTIPPAYAPHLPVSLAALSPLGQYVAIAGKRGMGLYSRSQRKWRLVPNVQQERELQVAGLTWWGEDKLIVVAKHRNSFSLLVFPRQHLDRSSLLNEVIKLPPGTRPLFLECVVDQEEPAFRARSTSRIPRQYRAESKATDRNQAAVVMLGDAQFLLFYRLARNHTPTGVTISSLYDLKVPLHRSLQQRPREPAWTKDWSPYSPHKTPAQVQPDNGSDQLQGQPFTSMGPGESPKRIVLLQDVHPRSIAILSSTGTLYRCEVRTAKTSIIAKDVSSFWLLPLPSLDPRLNPCYILNCGENGFSLWLPSLASEQALQLTYEASQAPFLDPTFNPDVEGVVMGVHSPTNSIIFLTQSCVQPHSHQISTSDGKRTEEPLAPRFEVGLQRRPIFQIVFRFLIFLHGMLRGPTSSGFNLRGLSSESSEESPTAKVVSQAVTDIFDVLYDQPETRIQLADALDFLVRSCIEAVAMAHSHVKHRSTTGEVESDFTSLRTSTEQVREALRICRREPSLTLFYEVIVRVARKIEPSRQRYIFPLPDLDSQGYGDTPVTLFEKCLSSRKLDTALLYLPLIDASAWTQNPSSGRNKTMLEANATEQQDLQVVHELSLRLLWQCLRRGRREWRMLKQLWRFIAKREDALSGRGESDGRREGQASDHAGQLQMAEDTALDRTKSSQETSRPILGFLYRYTVGLVAPSAAGGGSEDEIEGGQAGGQTEVSQDVEGSPRGMHYLAHLPRTMTKRGATSMLRADEAGDVHVVEEDLQGFELLRHVNCARGVVTLFCSMCLSTLRLRDLVDALLLLGSGDPLQVPYPSLRYWPRTGRTGRDKGKLAQRWPWSRCDMPAEVVLDTFLAIREQFALAGERRGDVGGRGGCIRVGRREATLEDRLSILGRICVELRDYEVLLALGTLLKDSMTVGISLKRSKITAEEYRRIFLDPSMDCGGLIKEMVERMTGVAIVIEEPEGAVKGLIDSAGDSRPEVTS